MAITETHVTLRLSDLARKKLTERAAHSGKDFSAVASELIERVTSLPTISEIIAPIQKGVADRGMGEDEIDRFLSSELAAYRQEKKADAS